MVVLSGQPDLPKQRGYGAHDHVAILMSGRNEHRLTMIRRFGFMFAALGDEAAHPRRGHRA